MIIVENHRKKLETLRKAYPDALILDVTSHATGHCANSVRSILIQVFRCRLHPV